MVAAAMLSSADPSWCTPECVLERVRKLGPIGLDPCSNENSIVGAAKELRLPDDGLSCPWDSHGLVYVNPPYGREITRWMQKCAAEYVLRGVEIVALVPARTDTKWWQGVVVPSATAVCFVRGRLTFLGAPAGAPFPSAILYYGARVAEFCEAFADLGWCL